MKLTRRLLVAALYYCAFDGTRLHPEAPGKATVIYGPSDPGSRSIFKNGVEYRGATDGRTLVVLIGYPEWFSGKFYSQSVAIYRRAADPITVDFSDFSGQMNDELNTQVAATDGDEAIDRERRSQRRVAAVANFLGAISSDMANTQTATVTDNTGYRATVSIPDPVARSREADREQQLIDSIEAQFSVARGAALRKNTLGSGQFVGGAVFFKKPKLKHGSRTTLTKIQAEVDGTRFIFVSR